MAWPLKFVTLVAQCEQCHQAFPQLEAMDYEPCPNGCMRDGSKHVKMCMPVDAATGVRPQVGDCFYRPDFLKAWPGELAPLYYASNAHRPPICVVLPGFAWWVVDSYSSRDTRGGPGGWTVTGDIQPGTPTLTCSPSIDYGKRYHGYVQGGAITDDCEGRKFAADGSSLP